MIGNIGLSNFKCFASQDFPLNNLTVLCGPNASGKSTVVQAILLNRLAVLSRDRKIPLNGPFGLHLGDFESLLSSASDNDDETVRIRVRWTATNKSECELRATDSPRFAEVVSSSHGDFPPDFVYLAAERIGPRVLQETFSDDRIDSGVGYAGQYTAEILSLRERERIRASLHQTTGADTSGAVLLLGAVQAWMSTLFGPIEVQTAPNGNAPPSLLFKRPGIAEEWVLSANTGFGFTYALPIVVAGLLCSEGSVLIVDSPEAHLHPAAQTALAKFFCTVAASGVHVLLETHSDYILDGIRIALTSNEVNTLQRDRCTFLSVGISERGERQVFEISIGEDGKPSQWPAGFFDQQILNMRALIENARAGE